MNIRAPARAIEGRRQCTVLLAMGAALLLNGGLTGWIHTTSASMQRAAALPLQPSRFSFRGVSFLLSRSVSSSAVGRLVPASAQGMGGPLPRYLSFAFPGYVWRAHKAYANIQVLPTSGLGGAHNTELGQLKSLLRTRPPLVTRTLPTVPGVNASEVFHVKESYLHFQNGSAVRYVGYWTQGVFSITNHDPLFYAFEGITSNGRYVVNVFVPVRIPFLPSQAHLLSPAKARTFSRRFQQYAKRIASRVENLPGDKLFPTLGALDQMSESLVVHPAGLR